MLLLNLLLNQMCDIIYKNLSEPWPSGKCPY